MTMTALLTARGGGFSRSAKAHRMPHIAPPVIVRSFGIYSDSWAVSERPSNTVLVRDNNNRNHHHPQYYPQPFSTQTSKEAMERLGITNPYRIQSTMMMTPPPQQHQQLLSSREDNSNNNITNSNNVGAVARHSHRRERQMTNPIARNRTAPRSGALFPLKAVHLGQTINLNAVLGEVFPTSDIQKRKLFGRNSLVLELPPTKVPEPPKYIAVFRFGSVVSLNIGPEELQFYMDLIRKHVTDPFIIGTEKREEFNVLLQPADLYAPPGTQQQQQQLPTKPVVFADYCIVPSLDLDGVAVISNIMAQTVALDTYNATADELLHKFASINSSVRASGKFNSSDKSFLFKSVAHNNAIFIDMISKIRLKDRSDTAWKMAKYEGIHYGLKTEFEIDDRFDQIEYKLNLIQQNSKFFLEVLNSEKTNSLEWTIAALIALECVLMCVDMTDTGPNVIEIMSRFSPF